MSQNVKHVETSQHPESTTTVTNRPITSKKQQSVLLQTTQTMAFSDSGPRTPFLMNYKCSVDLQQVEQDEQFSILALMLSIICSPLPSAV